MNIDQILHEASRAFSALDKAKAAVRAAEASVGLARRKYDLAAGTRGIRQESLRSLVEARYGKKSA